MNWTSVKETLYLSLKKMRMAGGQQKGMGSEALCQGLILKSFDGKKPQWSDFKNILLLKTNTTQDLLQLTKGNPYYCLLQLPSGNNQLTVLSSPFLLPYPSTSWPTLSAKTIFTSERLGLAFLAIVLPTLSTLCCHQCPKLGESGRKILPRT